MPISIEYLAGFFDGEGCVNLSVRGRTHTIFLRCMLVNTDQDLLREIQSQYGGTLRTKKSSGKPHWKDFCSLVWVGAEAIDLISRLLPHLRLKTRQAKLALDFAEFRKRPREERCDYTFSPAPGMPSRVLGKLKPEVLEKELDFKKRMHDLNRKGAVVH